MAVSNVDNSFGFPGPHDCELQLFRARLSDEIVTYDAKDMLHLPYRLRGKTGNYRFSIPGLPSLYLGNSSYACWIELGRPADYKYNVSPVLLDGSQKVFNLAVKTRELFYLNELEADRVYCWLKLLMLMIATSFRINEQGRTFKSEYIISQSIMLACRELGFDGVVYSSKRVSDEIFAVLARRGYFPLPEYDYVETHDSNGNPLWSVRCYIDEYGYFESVASSKKQAKKLAAYNMLLDVLENYDEE